MLFRIGLNIGSGVAKRAALYYFCAQEHTGIMKLDVTKEARARIMMAYGESCLFEYNGIPGTCYKFDGIGRSQYDSSEIIVTGAYGGTDGKTHHPEFSIEDCVIRVNPLRSIKDQDLEDMVRACFWHPDEENDASDEVKFYGIGNISKIGKIVKASCRNWIGDIHLAFDGHIVLFHKDARGGTPSFSAPVDLLRGRGYAMPFEMWSINDLMKAKIIKNNPLAF